MKNSLSQGSIAKNLILFSVPLVLSGLLQQLYNWADAFIVGNVEGEIQLAAIGATGSVSGLLVMMITGFTVGITILAAQLYGAGQGEKLKCVLLSFSLVMGGIFVVASGLGVVFTTPILRVLQTPADIVLPAAQYLRIVFTGIPFIVVYNIYAAVLRGMGDSHTPFFAIVVSALTNVLLDILLVVVFRHGVVGAAVATVTAQVLMAVFTVAVSAKKYPSLFYRIAPAGAMVDRDILGRGFRLSIPTALQSSVHSMGNLLLQNFMNGFGIQTVAAITTAYRIDTIIMLPINNLGEGISTAVAQNTGASNAKRAQKSLLVGTVIMSVVSIVLTVCIIPTGGSLIAMFGVAEEAVAIGQNFFRIIALFYFPYSIAIAVKGYLQGVGDVVFSGALSVAALGIRIVLSYRFRAQVGSEIIACAEALSWLALLVMCVLRYIVVARRMRNP